MHEKVWKRSDRWNGVYINNEGVMEGDAVCSGVDGERSGEEL